MSKGDCCLLVNLLSIILFLESHSDYLAQAGLKLIIWVNLLK